MSDNETFLGLRTVVYPVTDIIVAKEWYSEVLGIDPYFDQPYYVGFNVGGFELGLDPDTNDGTPGATGGIIYWGVPHARNTYNRLLQVGAAAHKPPREVGEKITVASVLDPFGNVFGIIENPHFKAK